MQSKFLRHALALVPALFLAACGGGGGGSSGGGAPTAVQLAITGANSQAVAAESLEASASYEAAASGGALVTGVQVEAGSGANPVLLAKASRALLAKAGGGTSLAMGVAVDNQTVNCSGGGTLTVSYNIASTTSVLAAGDTMSFTAANCREGTGADTMLLNGSMRISILSGSFDSAGAYPRSVTMRTVARSFSVVTGGETMVANGDITLALTERSPSDADVRMSSSMMSSTVGSHAITLKDYTQSVTETATGATVTMSATIETTNSKLGGSLVSYVITTPAPLVINASGQVTAGAIKVTGANGTSLVLTVTGTDTFSLKVDADGNGTYETTSTTTRTALVGLL